MNQKIKIFNKDNFKDFLQILIEIGLELDIYYYPSFLDIDAKIQKGEYEIFFFIKGNEVFIYPYIKLPFYEEKFKEYFDISSPYGYCGPFCSSELIFQEGEEAFVDYIKSNCVTEFVRYHYIYNDTQKFTKQIQNLQNRTVVTLDTTLDWETIWSKEFSVTNRNLIRKLEKEEYKFVLANKKEDLLGFLEMYYSTMKNAGASNFYFFEKDLINRLYEALGEKMFLVKVEKDSIVYSYSLFFISGGIGTYYLSARNVDYPKIPGSNYLLAKAVELLQEKGTFVLNFGGGLTNEPDDYLFKFKRNFSKRTKEFFIGKRIFNNNIYNQLVNDWINLHGENDYEKRKHILQFYR
jgi:lipid II:glycine glycyltransferase (peptidoglycan interpeptide bridge formation enzyme)